MKNIIKISLKTTRTKIPCVFLLLFLMLFSITLKSQNVGINSTGATPATSAMLDVVSTTSGVLIPRMTHMQITSISAPATGLLAYSTDTIGFYFYNGAAWVPILANSTNNGGWTISGNSGTTPSGAAIGTTITAGSHFTGTTDAKDLVFVTNDGTTYERMRIASTGFIGIANKTPSALLDIGTAGSTAGVIRLEGSTTGYTAITSSAGAGSWNMILPGTAGTLNQVLLTDGTGITSWATPSSAVSSVASGHTPIVVSPTTGNVVVRIEGTTLNSGGVLYSKGSGTSADFNAQGTTPNDYLRQVLVSQGAATPTWNTIGGYTYYFFKGDLQTSGTTAYATIGSGLTKAFSVWTGYIETGNVDNTRLYMPKCRITRIRININSNTFTGANSATAQIWVNNTHLTAYDITIAAGATGNQDMCVGNNLSIYDGQTLEIYLSTGTQGGSVIGVSSVQVTSYPLH